MDPVKYTLAAIAHQIPQSNYFIEKEIEMVGLSCYDRRDLRFWQI